MAKRRKERIPELSELTDFYSREDRTLLSALANRYYRTGDKKTAALWLLLLLLAPFRRRKKKRRKE